MKERSAANEITPAEPEAAFVQAIASSPNDDALRLVYADWLEEQGEDRRSRWLRIECQWHEEQREDGVARQETRRKLAIIGSRIEAGWAARMARVPVEKCQVAAEFEFECPQQWEKLRLTADDGVRFCETCQSKVYFCRSIREARSHASQGQCVAIESSILRRQGDLDRRLKMGRIRPQLG